MVHVIKLLISIFCALLLTFAPVTASAAPMAPDEMRGCTMAGKMPAKPGHSKVDCCTSACVAQSPALLPDKETAERLQVARTASLFPAPVKELVSIASSGLDPPPRA